MSESTNPYVGPVPFQYKQKDDDFLGITVKLINPYFFGRDEEAATLKSLAISERIVLFYAQSGAGKSSLVNARLIPELEEKGLKAPRKREYKEELPPPPLPYKVYPARVGGDLPSDVPAEKVENIFVFNLLLSLAETKRGLFGERKDAKALVGQTLPSYVTEKSDFREDRPHWLIIDQFEEIITAHPTENEEKRKDFFRQVKLMMDLDEHLSVVLVMREDHLAGLDNYAPLLPDRLNARYRMERLKRKAAEQAVRSPASKAGREFEDGAAEELVRDLSQVRIADEDRTVAGEYVEPLFIQLVCFSLWKTLDELKAQKTEEADKVITKDDVKAYGDIDAVLMKFYNDAVKEVADRTKTNEMAIRRWFGEKLITPSGIRSMVNRGLLKSGELPNKVVDLLLSEAHIVRLEEVRGGKWYELSHDRFIAPILKSNEQWLSRGEGNPQLTRAARLWNKFDGDESFLFRGRLLDRAQNWYEKNKEAAGPLEEAFLQASMNAQAKRSRQYRSAIFALVVLLLASVGLTFIAYRRKQYADDREKLAEQQKIIAYKETITAKNLQEQIKKNYDEQEAQYKELVVLRNERADLAEAQGSKERNLRKRAEDALKKAGEALKDAKRQQAIAKKESDDAANRFVELQKADSQLKLANRFFREFFREASGANCDENGDCTSDINVVGRVRWRPIPGGGFEFLDHWKEKNIETVEIPELKSVGAEIPALRTVQAIPSRFDGQVQFYKGAVTSLKEAWRDVAKAGLLDQVIAWEGSVEVNDYESPVPESHSVGLAFDIKVLVPKPSTGQVAAKDDKLSRLISIFASHGFQMRPWDIGEYHVQFMGTPP